jgi:hypothetical protein
VHKGDPQIVFVEHAHGVWLKLTHPGKVVIDEAERMSAGVETHGYEWRGHLLRSARASHLHHETGNVTALGIDDEAQKLTQLSIVACANAQPTQATVIYSCKTGRKISRLAHWASPEH